MNSSLDDLFDNVERRETHRTPNDWRIDANGRMRYVGLSTGWYSAPTIVEDGEAGTRPQDDPREPVTYVIHAPEVGRLKIGSTNRLRWRLKSLQTGSPVKLSVSAVFHPESEHSERSLHARFSDYRVHGEWYSDEILDELMALAAE